MTTTAPLDSAEAESAGFHLDGGKPTVEELAAVIALITALAAQKGADPVVLPGSRWVSGSRERARRLPSPGPGRWREVYAP